MNGILGNNRQTISSVLSYVRRNVRQMVQNIRVSFEQGTQETKVFKSSYFSVIISAFVHYRKSLKKKISQKTNNSFSFLSKKQSFLFRGYVIPGKIPKRFLLSEPVIIRRNINLRTTWHLGSSWVHILLRIFLQLAIHKETFHVFQKATFASIF